MSLTRQAAYTHSNMRFLFAGLMALALLIASCGDSDRRSDKEYADFFEIQNKLIESRQFDRAVANVDSLYRATPNPSAYLKYRRMKFEAWYNYFQDKKETSRKCNDSAVYILEQSDLTQKYPEEYARVLYSRGDYFFNNGEYDSAFANFSRSRAIALSLANDYLIGRESYHLGMITYQQERYSEAAVYFKHAFFSISRTNLTDSFQYYWMQEILNNAGLAYTKLDSADSAKKYYFKALDYIKTEGGRFSGSPRQRKMADVASGVVMGNLAKVYIAGKRFDTAELLLLKSIALNAQPGYDNIDAVSAEMQLAELYYNNDRKGEAFTLLNRITHELENVQNAGVELRCNELLAYYYMDVNQPGLSAAHLKRFRFLNDSITRTVNKVKKTDYTQLLVQQDARYQVKLLQRDNEIKQLCLLLAIGFTVIFVAILLLGAAAYIRNKKNLLTVTTLNARINEQNTLLETTLRDLRDTNQEKNRILRNVAHDMRSPVSIVVMVGSLLYEEETDPGKKKSILNMVKASESVVELSEEIMEFSEDNEAEIASGREKIDTRDIANEVADVLKFKADEKSQKLVLDLPEDPVNTFVFKEKILRVLTNLVSNAIKFSNNDSEIHISVSANESKALMKVKDSGIGIPSGFIEKIFEPFTIAKRRGTSGERSYGLGLSICRQITDAHNGSIYAESEEGKGSTFTVELPLV